MTCYQDAFVFCGNDWGTFANVARLYFYNVLYDGSLVQYPLTSPVWKALISPCAFVTFSAFSCLKNSEELPYSQTWSLLPVLSTSTPHLICFGNRFFFIGVIPPAFQPKCVSPTSFNILPRCVSSAMYQAWIQVQYDSVHRSPMYWDFIILGLIWMRQILINIWNNNWESQKVNINFVLILNSSVPYRFYCSFSATVSLVAQTLFTIHFRVLRFSKFIHKSCYFKTITCLAFSLSLSHTHALFLSRCFELFQYSTVS